MDSVKMDSVKMDSVKMDLVQNGFGIRIDLSNANFEFLQANC